MEIGTRTDMHHPITLATIPTDTLRPMATTIRTDMRMSMHTPRIRVPIRSSRLANLRPMSQAPATSHAVQRDCSKSSPTTTKTSGGRLSYTTTRRTSTGMKRRRTMRRALSTFRCSRTSPSSSAIKCPAGRTSRAAFHIRGRLRAKI